MDSIAEIRRCAVELPLKAAFETAKGSKTTSPALVVELVLVNEITGLGSGTPVTYVTGETIESVMAAVDSCREVLLNRDVSAYRGLLDTLAEALPDQPSARAALETAVLDAFCKTWDIPLWIFLGGFTAEVETDVTIPIVDPETAGELAREAAADGFRHLKIKVGKDAEEDYTRVISVQSSAPACEVLLDANQGFSPEEAVRFTDRLTKAGVKINMLEQPVDARDIEGLAYVTKHTSVPVFADESAQKPSDVLRLVKADAVDGINIKLMKSGISGALDIIAICKAAGKELMLGSMLEIGVGLSAAVHLACGTGVFSRLDLDSHLLASEEPFPGGYTWEGPIIRANPTAAGHGAEPKR